MRRPLQSAGTVNCRRYHSRGWCSITPLMADSTGKGTRISLDSVWPVGVASPSAAGWYSQRPLRFCQSGRVICGRGYSGSGALGSTSAAHWVISGAFFISHRHRGAGGEQREAEGQKGGGCGEFHGGGLRLVRHPWGGATAQYRAAGKVSRGRATWGGASGALRYNGMPNEKPPRRSTKGEKFNVSPFSWPSTAVFKAETVALLIVAVLLATTAQRRRSSLTSPAELRAAAVR